MVAILCSGSNKFRAGPTLSSGSIDMPGDCREVLIVRDLLPDNDCPTAPALYHRVAARTVNARVAKLAAKYVRRVYL